MVQKELMVIRTVHAVQILPGPTKVTAKRVSAVVAKVTAISEDPLCPLASPSRSE